MSNVTRLPDSMERAWRTVAEDLASALRSAGHDEPTVGHIVVTLKPIYLRASKDEFRADGLTGDQALAALNDWVGNLTNWMMLEIANREIELYQAGLR